MRLLRNASCEMLQPSTSSDKKACLSVVSMDWKAWTKEATSWLVGAGDEGDDEEEEEEGDSLDTSCSDGVEGVVKVMGPKDALGDDVDVLLGGRKLKGDEFSKVRGLWCE